MIIIWGSKGREIELGAGHFHCPVCAIRQPYRHIRVARYFTLYFVPLIETENLGQFVKCQVCERLFAEDLLHARPPMELSAIHDDELLDQVREELEMGTSIEETKRLLLDQGHDGETAIQLVKMAAAGRQKPCPRCKVNYLDSVQRCSRCGEGMEGTTGSITSVR